MGRLRKNGKTKRSGRLGAAHPAARVGRSVDPVAPPPEQVASALAARAARVPPSQGSAAVEDWGRWLMSTGQPFAVQLANILNSFSPAGGGRELTASDEDLERLRKLAPTAAQYFSDRQDGLLTELVDLVATVQGVPLLATTMFLTQGRAWGHYYEPDSEPNTLDHEILAAVVAGQQPHDGRHPNPTDLLRCIHLTREIRSTAQALSEASALSIPQPAADDALRATVIRRWLTVRGASIPKFAQGLAREFSRAYGNQFVNRLGFRFEDLESLTRHIQAKWRVILRDANTASWEFAKKATGQNPQTLAGTSPEWRYHYYQALLLLMPVVMSFSVPDLNAFLSDPAGKYTSRATAILQHLGTDVGTWEEAPRPLGDTPVRTRPFMMWSPPGDVNRRALLVNPSALDVDMASTMEVLLNREFPRNWSQKRAQVVDDYAVRLLSERLAGSLKASGIHVRDRATGREFEMDGLVIAGDVALVVEGKGAPLKLASLRGDVKRLLSQFRGLIAEAWAQLQRDQDALFGPSAPKFELVRSETGDPLANISTRRTMVRKIYPVIPTLDGLGEAGSNLSTLYELNILPNSAAPWIISVPDLALVVETLQNAPEFLAYLRFREKWSKHPQVRFHDQIEMLAAFLEGTDLHIKLAPIKDQENGIAFISGGQTRFDDYYAYINGEGPPAERPRKKMTPRVRRVVDSLTRLKPEGWIDSAVAFLSLSIADAVAIDHLWAAVERELHYTRWVHRGDDRACVVAAQSDINWNSLLAVPEILETLRRTEIVCFARCDFKNRLRLEWASFGVGVREFPRWDF